MSTKIGSEMCRILCNVW